MIHNVKDYEIVSLLGKGAYGAVYKVKKKSSSQMFAMKVINLLLGAQSDLLSIENEAKILSQLNNENIVKLIEYFKDEQFFYMIMELCDGGDLNKLIMQKKNKKELFTEPEVKQMFFQICKGVEYLHSHKIIHRDLKTMNIFLGKNGQIKIGDFGVSKQLKGNLFAYTVIGTPYYLSPELCMQKPYDDKSDIWSLGVILYEMINLKKPFECNTQFGLMSKIMKEPPEPMQQRIKSTYSTKFLGLIYSLLEKNPKRRFNIQQIYNSGVFKSLESSAKEKSDVVKPNINSSNNKILKKNPCVSKPTKQFVNQRVRRDPKNKEEVKLSRRAMMVCVPQRQKTNDFKSKKEDPQENPIDRTKTNQIVTTGKNKLKILFDNEDNKEEEFKISGMNKDIDFDLSSTQFMKNLMKSNEFNEIFTNTSSTVDNNENLNGPEKVRATCSLLNEQITEENKLNTNIEDNDSLEENHPHEDNNSDNNEDEIPILDDLNKAYSNFDNIHDIENKDEKINGYLMEAYKLIGREKVDYLLELYEKFEDNPDNHPELFSIIYEKCGEVFPLFIELFYKIIYLKYIKKAVEKPS